MISDNAEGIIMTALEINIFRVYFMEWMNPISYYIHAYLFIVGIARLDLKSWWFSKK